MPGLSRPLRVIGVQLEVSRETFLSLESYREAVWAPVLSAARRFPPDLIVFPEYAAGLLALLPYGDALAESATVAEGVERIGAAGPGVLRRLFLGQAGRVEDMTREVFGGLARKTGGVVVAGSGFVRHAGGTLRNRAAVFGRDGLLLHTRDKVFLTDFEREQIGVSPGSLEDTALFPAADARVALTLCRDTFHPDWESPFRDADLWVDIKANGTAYTPQEEMDFRNALPARLLGSGVRQGITVCLVGSLLDLRWEGESSVEELAATGVRTVSRAGTATRGSVLCAELYT